MLDFSKVGFEPEQPMGPPSGPAPPPPGRRNSLERKAEFDDIGALVDLNITGAKAAIKLFDDHVTDMERQAAELEVKSSEAAQNATEMTGQVKRLAKSIDERRKEIIAEPDSFVRKVNGFVKPLSDRLKTLEGFLKRKLSDFAYQQELARREAERLQREAAEKLQAELNQQAAAKGVEPVQVAPVALQQKQGPTRSDTAVASTVMVWKHEVTDPKAVPREYLMVDDAAIKAAIRGGIREIPGVRIYEDAEMRVRRVG